MQASRSRDNKHFGGSVDRFELCDFSMRKGQMAKRLLKCIAVHFKVFRQIAKQKALYGRKIRKNKTKIKESFHRGVKTIQKNSQNACLKLFWLPLFQHHLFLTSRSQLHHEL